MSANTSESHRAPVKRRVRIVMSCDQCRAKKIKCVKIPGQLVCKACAESDNVCTFRDRDQYQAERDRMNASRIAPGATGTTGPLAHEGDLNTYSSGHSTPLGAQGASMTFYSFAVTPDQPDTSSGSTPEAESSRFTFSAELSPSPSSQGSTRARSRSERGSSTRPHSAHAEPASTPVQPILWSPLDPTQPNPALMPHFIDTFFTHLAPAFPFMRYECVVGEFFSSTLSPFVANCIASLSVPLAIELEELATTNMNDAAEQYAQKAKALAPRQSSTLRDLGGLVLLSHCELQSGRSSEFRRYAQRTVNAAIAVGMVDEAAVNIMSESASHREELLALWHSIADLHQMSS